MDDLVLRLAHEIRNPLTSIKLLVQTAARRSPSGHLDSKQLDVLQEDIARIERTVQSLLDFTRPEHRCRYRLDLRQMLKRAVSITEDRARQQGIAIVTHCPDSPVPVHADPERLQQVFVNLLLEWIESSVEGGTLTAAVHIAVGPPPQGIITVSQAPFPKNFARPDHSDRPQAATARGTRLALDISRGIVERHGGKLTVTSPDGEQSVFTVEIPLA